LRAAANKDTAAIMESFLNCELPQLLPENEIKEDEVFHSWRERRVITLFGEIKLSRAYYLGPEGGRYPTDEKLGLHDQYTPAVTQLMCWSGAMDPSFEQASETLKRFAELDIPGRQVQRVIGQLASHASEWKKDRICPEPKKPISVLNIQADMTGIPMRPEELVDVKGKQPDGSARTRQIKVGCVFTQSMDSKGQPQRDPSSSVYVSTFGEVSDLSTLLHSEAVKAGYATAKKTVFLGDGAEWIWRMVEDRFNGVVQIVDFYHACEHLNTLCQTLIKKPAQAEELFKAWRKRLKNNGLAGIIQDASEIAGKLGRSKRKSVKDQLMYFSKNAHRMTYRSFRRKGYFIGSGAIEGACRHIVCQRAKLSGMRWLRSGAASVITFRCIIKSNLFDDYCKSWPLAA